jgi:hypothetical protein
VWSVPRRFATVEAEGYNPVDRKIYASQNTLTALFGINAKSATGTYQHAFFLLVSTSVPTGRIRVHTSTLPSRAAIKLR